MFTGGFDYKTAKALHQDRLNEAEKTRRTKAAQRTAKTLVITKNHSNRFDFRLRYRIGKQLIAIGEKMTA